LQYPSITNDSITLAFTREGNPSTGERRPRVIEE